MWFQQDGAIHFVDSMKEKCYRLVIGRQDHVFWLRCTFLELPEKSDLIKNPELKDEIIRIIPNEIDA